MKKRNRLFKLFAAAAIALGLSSVLVLGSCTTTNMKYDVPFGAESAAGPFSVKTAKTGEGEILLTLTSSAHEELAVDVRMRRTEIGFDYGQHPSNMDPKFYSDFVVDPSKRSIVSGATQAFSINLENRHQVSRPFYTIIYINAQGGDSRYQITVRVDDSDMFSDIEYLRQLNKTDYWHPRIIRENWEKYLSHIGQ